MEEAASKLAAALAETLPGDTDLLGPAPMFRVRNRYRRRLLTKAQDREATVTAIRAAVERLAADRSLKDVAIGVDVDPAVGHRPRVDPYNRVVSDEGAVRTKRSASGWKRSCWSGVRRRSPRSSSSATRC